MTGAGFFTIDGVVRAGTGVYLTRPADDALHSALAGGDFCAVVAPRQTGKTSLKERTMERLRAGGVTVAAVELGSPGQNATEEQWYFGIFDSLARQLGCDGPGRDHWNQAGGIGPGELFRSGLHDVLVKSVPERLVFLFDETDAVRMLRFPVDAFFASLRQAWGGSGGAFAAAFFGTQPPEALVAGIAGTPFEVAKRIVLEDFTAAEMAVLAEGLPAPQATALLTRIRHWTDGHPYLTQRLAAAAADPAVTRPRDIDRLCRKLFLNDRAGREDPVLQGLCSGFLSKEQNTASLLDSHRRLLHRAHRYDPTDIYAAELLRMGAARLIDGPRIAVRNRIIAAALDRHWVQRALPPAEAERQQRAYRRGRRRALTVCAAVALLSAGGLYAAWRVRRHDDAHARVDRLLSADPAHVPALLDDVRARLETVRDRLATIADEPTAAPGDRLRAAMALVATDERRVPGLALLLTETDARDAAALRDVLHAHRDRLEDDLWRRLERPPQGREGVRLRAAHALAAYDPDDPRWGRVADAVAGELLASSQDPVAYGLWIAGLEPVRRHLRPALEKRFRSGSEAERRLAAGLLAGELGEDGNALADLIVDADPAQFAALFPRLQPHAAAVRPKLRAMVPAITPATPVRRDWLAALTLFRLGDPASARRLLQHTSQPELRSELIHAFAPYKADAAAVLHAYHAETDVGARRAWLLALGTFPAAALAATERKAVTDHAAKLHAEATDPGLRAAAEWLLRSWGRLPAEATDPGLRAAAEWLLRSWGRLPIAPAVSAVPPPADTPRWFASSHAGVLVALPPATFEMGSPPDEPGRDDSPVGVGERRRTATVTRRFAIADRCVTIWEFKQFKREQPTEKRYAPDVNCPVHHVSWYDAVAYCNWLSDQEKLPRCYDGTGPGLIVPKDALTRTGYRLATEEEWEYACRAGAVTRRSYGSADHLLPHYARFVFNSNDCSAVAGTHKPNDWGLFDMHGNVWQWCHTRLDRTGSPAAEPTGPVSDQDFFLLRGGSFYNPPAYVRAAERYRYGPTHAFRNIGFRVVRTLPPSPGAAP